MPRAGKYNRRVVLQSFADTVNTFGETDPTDPANWTSDATLWARVNELSGRERLLAQQITPDATTQIDIRFRNGVTVEKRFLVPLEATTLGAAIATTDGTAVTLSSAFGASTRAPHAILVGSEFMWVTAGQGTTSITVARAAFGTTGAVHSNGATVQMYKEFYISAAPDVEGLRIEIACVCSETP